MKTFILVVDPYSTGALFAPEIRRRGIIPVALLTDIEIPEYVTKSIRREDFDQIFTDLNQLAEFFADGRQLLACIPGCESGVVVADQISRQFGINGNDPESSKLRRNKYSMQEALRIAGLPYIKTRLLKEGDAYSEILKEFGRSALVVKPAQATASEGVTYSKSWKEALELLESISWGKKNCLGTENDEYLIQEYIAGTEYVVDMVALQGDYFVAAVFQYTKIRANDASFVYFQLEALDSREPALIPLITYAKSCAYALGVKYGAAHMEIIQSLEGPKMVEVGARLHGGVAPLLIRHCYSSDLVASTVDSYINKAPQEATYLKEHGRIALVIASREGAFSGIGERDMLALSSISTMKGYRVWAPKNAAFRRTTDLVTCPARAWFSGTREQAIEEDEMRFRQIMSGYFD